MAELKELNNKEIEKVAGGSDIVLRMPKPNGFDAPQVDGAYIPGVVKGEKPDDGYQSQRK